MTEKSVLVERKPLQVPEQYMGLITLNRPKEMNPMDWGTVKELKTAVHELSADKSVRLIALTGSGKAFSAGGDLKGYLTLQRDEPAFKRFLDDILEVCESMRLSSKPVLALVNGYCVAGGLELFLACDLAYAAESAKIGDGHVNFGQIGGGGSNVRLPRWIMPSLARELLFTGRLLSAQESLQWGLLNKVVPDDKLLEAGLELANTLALKSALGLSIIKDVCNRSLDMPIEEGLRYEIDKVFDYALTSHDCREGLNAFSEKRKPKFLGR